MECIKKHFLVNYSLVLLAITDVATDVVKIKDGVDYGKVLPLKSL